MKTGIKHSIVVLGMLVGTAGSAFAGYFNPTPITNCNVQITSNLSTGSEGNQVRILQNILARGGYLHATPNGHFGPSTRAAVIAFQADNYISRTGTVGAATRNALNERACDNDVTANGYSYNSYGYGYTSGSTYVESYDPYAQVISPITQTPVVYNTPGTVVVNSSAYTGGFTLPTNVNTYSIPTTPVIPSTSSGISSTNIIYNPSTGYTYGIVPTPGTLTITTPFANSVYKEGDVINVAWTTSNLQAGSFRVFLENTQSGQSKEVAQTLGSNASFTLTKEILDIVCSTSCSTIYGYSSKDAFRIIVATPLTDIAGQTSLFRATVAPITINRPQTPGIVSVSASKTPVDSGEVFRLYVNMPSGLYWNTGVYGQYSYRVSAVCQTTVQVSIAGTPCGQTFSLPVTANYSQQEVPVRVANTSWYRQDVSFRVDVVDTVGNVVATSQTSVTINPAPFSW